MSVLNAIIIFNSVGCDDSMFVLQFVDCVLCYVVLSVVWFFREVHLLFSFLQRK